MIGVWDFRHFMGVLWASVRYHVFPVFALLFMLLGGHSLHHLPSPLGIELVYCAASLSPTLASLSTLQLILFGIVLFVL
jgi:hypothetical protein